MTDDPTPIEEYMAALQDGETCEVCGGITDSRGSFTCEDCEDDDAA